MSHEHLDEIRRQLAQAVREEYETRERMEAAERVLNDARREMLAPLLAHQEAALARARRLHAEFLALGGDPADRSYDWPPAAVLCR